MMHSVEVEQAVLGTILLSPDAIIKADLRAEDFFDAVHSEIFQACWKKMQSGHLISPVTVGLAMAGHVGLEELGGGQYLVRLAGAATGVSSLPDYVKELRLLAQRRSLSETLAQGAEALGAGRDPADVLGMIEAATTERIGKGAVSFAKALADASDLAMEAHKGEGVPGVSTGLKQLDDMLGGLHTGDLILLGGRPSMGKTAVALDIALNVARSGAGVAIASLEMTPDALALRAISNQSARNGKAVSYTDARRGAMDDMRARNYFEASTQITDLPIQILPPDARDIGALIAGVRRSGRILEAKGHSLGLVVVDYLQLLSGASERRLDAIAEVSIALKGLALRMGVPVLALSQLSRAVEGRDNKRPVLSDLRESGQLEQDADVVIFTYRHEYYLERERPLPHATDEVAAWQEAMDATRGELELIVAKQRMGAIGTVKVGFNAAANYLWDAA